MDSTQTIFHAGKRGQELAAMHKAKLPVPAGFIISAEAFKLFCEQNEIEREIPDFSAKISTLTEQTVKEVAKKIRSLILRGEFPESLVQQILSSYIKLGEPRVMLLPSTFVADEEKQFLGHIDQVLYGYEGDANLFKGIKQLWSQFFTPKLLVHRIKHGHTHLSIPFAIAVQQQPKGKVTAVVYTNDATSATKQTGLVKAVFGEGALIDDLAGADYYWIKRGSGEVYKEFIDTQKSQVSLYCGQEELKKTALTMQKRRKLSGSQLEKLGKVIAQVQQHFFFPQIVTVTFDGDRFSIIESKPHQENGTDRSAVPKELHSPLPKTEKPDLKTPAKIHLGLIHLLTPAKHIPSVARIEGHLFFQATPLLQQFTGQLDRQKKKTLGYQVRENVSFSLQHAQPAHGVIYDFTDSFEDHDQIEAQLTALQQIRLSFPQLPIVLTCPVTHEEEYGQWLRYWQDASLVRSSTIHYAVLLQTPASLFSIEQFVARGVDAIVLDLDALDHALHGGMNSIKEIKESKALAQIVETTLSQCEHHGISLFFLSGRRVTRDFFSQLSTSVPLEWITQGSLYQQLNSVLGLD